MNVNTLLLTVLMALVTVGAQLLMKKGLSGIEPEINDFASLLKFVLNALGNLYILTSMLLQALGFVLWM